MLDVALPTAPQVIRYDRPDMVLRAVTNMLNLGRARQAEEILGDLLREYPDQAEVYALLGGLEARRGNPDAALPLHQRAVEMDPTNQMLHSALIFALDQSADVTLERAYQARRRFNDLVKVDPDQIAPHPNDRDPERRIKVGYVSNDFKNHSAVFGWAPVLLCHDPEEVELYAYSCSQGADWVAEEIKGKVEHWRSAARWNDDRLEAQIRADQIDVLIDLSGHSSGHRLPVFARKPAPVQITGWGYITGTGLDAMDYLFADEDTIKPDEERWYAEEIIRLPRILTFWPTDPNSVGEVAPLPAAENDYLTFGVFNRLGKIQPACARAWGAILAHLPTARLVVKSPGLDDENARAGLERMFDAAGCDLTRLEFRGTTTKDLHLKAYHLIDVALDPSPHGGGMSTLEAAWMGVPTLTLPHVQIPSRIATTINHEVGLSYLVADSWDDYVARAIALDTQRVELARVRGLLRDIMRVSSFGDHGTYAKSVEVSIRELWRRWCVGEAPRKLRVVS
jgi:predicted O-linked N-acetylglucosamine transferase (SPINDLY family)